MNWDGPPGLAMRLHRRQWQHWAPWVAAGLATASVTIVIVVGRRRWSRSIHSNADEERQKLLAVLNELSRRFFVVCRDVASIAKPILLKLEAAGTAVTKEQIQQQLSTQCKVFEKLESIQQEVSAKFGCTPKDVERMQRRFANHPEVQAYTEGFKAMLTDALEGSMPILPNFRIPEGLNPEKVLLIQAEMHKLEIDQVLKKVGGKQCTMKFFTEVLTESTQFSWEQTCKTYATLLEDGGPEALQSILALYSKEDLHFADKKKKLDEAHQKKLARLIQPDVLRSSPNP